MERDNLKTIHGPLSLFYYGSLAVIFISLCIGAYYFSYRFIENEKKRAEISSLHVKDSINTEYRYIVEEFFTGSFDSIAMRIHNSLEKFGNPNYELFLFNENDVCLYAKSSQGSIDCKSAISHKPNFLNYQTDLKLTTDIIGRMRVNVEDRFQFFTGNLSEFAFNVFAPVFLIVAILWISWVMISRRKILIPYYRKMLSIEKDKASLDTIRQIIHDTKGDIASLDLLSYEIEDQERAQEMRSTLDKIRKTFDNLHQVKDTILPTKNESLTKVYDLMSQLESHQILKYKNMSNLKLEFDFSKISHERLRLDSGMFERVVSNLIENAVTAPCGQDVRVVKVQAVTIENSISFQVMDNCVGISEENLERIFEKGFTTKDSGTGQGLPFVKQQVESWGGNIHVASQIEEGTVVTFSVPQASKPIFVLLDDDKYLLLRYQKMFKRFGNEADIYDSANSLLANVRNMSPESIFLLDYDLGGDEVGTDVALKLSNMGMKNLYLHTGNPMTDEINYPFLKGILTKGNFAETLKALNV